MDINFRPNKKERHAHGYGWVIVLFSMIGLAFGIFSVGSFTFGLFLAPLSHEFGWKLHQIAIANLVFVHAIVLSAPLIGRVLDRANPRLIIPASTFLYGVLVTALSLLTNNIFLYYAAFAFIAIAGGATTPVAFAKLVARWFDDRLGLALGIMMSGTGIGAAIMPLFAARLITAYGWRGAFLSIGLVIAFVVAPVLALFLRNPPVKTDREAGTSLAAFAPSGDNGQTLSAAARSFYFWSLVLGFAMLGFAFGSVVVPLAVMLGRQGLSPAIVAIAMAAMGASNFAGRVIVGTLLDRFDPILLGVGIWLPAAGFMLLLGFATTPAILISVVIIIGLALGAEVDILSYLVRRKFGLAHMAQIFGVLFSVYIICGAWGSVFVARLMEQAGGVLIALGIMSASAVVGCGVLLSVRRRRTVEVRDAEMAIATTAALD